MDFEDKDKLNPTEVKFESIVCKIYQGTRDKECKVRRSSTYDTHIIKGKRRQNKSYLEVNNSDMKGAALERKE